MCRLFAYAGPPVDLAPYLLAPATSLRSLACEHSDGWGIAAWRDPTEAAFVAKAPEDAESGAAFERAARTRAPRVLAHIRKTSSGAVSMPNTHPWSYGRWAFCHNGTLWGIEERRDALLGGLDEDLRRLRVGETDSEVAFLLFLQELRTRHGSLDVDLDGAGSALASLARRLEASFPGTPERPSKLNFLAGNGDGFVATKVRHSLATKEEGLASVVASVPFGPQAGWREVPDRSVLVVRPGKIAWSPL